MIRTMLAPFQSQPYAPRQLEAVIAEHDPAELVQALIQQGLAPLWSDFIDSKATDLQVGEQIGHELHRRRMAFTALYMLQKRSAAHVCRCLSDAQIPCALFKGIAQRERLFDSPSARPARDVDILIAPEHRETAIRALLESGLRFQGSRKDISHEAVLLDGTVIVDLHWNLFRPGRCRVELASMLLDRIKLDGAMSALDDDANLLVMLVHPAFAKHVNGRLSTLIRVVELDRMLRSTTPDWEWILAAIDQAGVRTAAWAVLYWTRKLMGSPIDASVIDRLTPGTLHAQYLALWIDHGLTQRLDRVPGLLQFGFSLALHDRLGDAARAAARVVKTRLDSRRTFADLVDAISVERP